MSTDPNPSESQGDTIPRREFIQTSSTLAVAAASWWALTEKNDALAQAQQPVSASLGTDPMDQNYSYIPGVG